MSTTTATHEFQPYRKSQRFCGYKIDNYARCSLPATADVHYVKAANPIAVNEEQPPQPDRASSLSPTQERLENAFLMAYDLAGIDAEPLPERLPESAYTPGYMSKVRELREVFAIVRARAANSNVASNPDDIER